LRHGGFLAQRNLKQSKDEPEFLDPHRPDTSRKADRDFSRAAHKRYSADDKIRIVLLELRGEESVSS
jgi:hypothetical protein